MRDALDMLDGMHLKGFLVEETARNAYDNKPQTGSTVEFAIRESEFTDVVKGTIKSLRPRAVFNDGMVYYKSGDIPVKIRVVKSKDDMFKNLDSRWYNYDNFHFPNPFEKYWENREKIK